MERGGSVKARHDFLNVVLAGIGDGGEVGVGVVEFVVKDVLKGGDLREGVAEVVQQALPARMVFGNDEDDHPLACAGVADDEVAEAAGVVADVVEGELVSCGVVADGQPDAVAEGWLEGAMLYVEDLVEEGGDVESQGTRRRGSVRGRREVVPGP